MGRVTIPAGTRARVLAEFRRTGRIDLATQAAGVERSTHYRWLKKQPHYREQFDAAVIEVAGMLEAEAVRRAHEGVEEPVFHAGRRAMDFARDAAGELIKGPDGKFVEMPASVRRYSDNLLMFLLEGRNPAVFSRRTESNFAAAGASIQLNVMLAGQGDALQVTQVQAQVIDAGQDEDENGD